MTLIRTFRARPRLAVAVVAAVLLWCILPNGWRGSTRMLVSLDSGMAFYLILAMGMIAVSSIDQIRLRAPLQDDGKFIILLLTICAAAASLIAIIRELSIAKEMLGNAKQLHIGLAGITVFLSWTFMQTMFALHYAHEYYVRDDKPTTGGLEFPGEKYPDYWDFIYFSFIIGTAVATADVNITSRIIRRTATLHCMIMFFFNTTILALSINIGAGLL